MSMKKLFQIGAKDYTKYIKEHKYSMRRVELFQEWRDGNFNIRRAHQRWQIEGTFILSFFTEADYDAFIAAITAATNADGWCTVKVFVEDDKTFTAINAFVEYKPRIVWTNETAGTRPAVAELEVRITER